MLRYILILLIVVPFTSELRSQDIAKHRWQNRLIMVIVKDYNNETFIEQLSVLNTCKAGLLERKLLIYQILPDKYKVSATYGNEVSWNSGNLLFEQFRSSDASFEIILVGLDGGIKLRKQDLLDCKELWAVIDNMPMRQAEIRSEKSP